MAIVEILKETLAFEHNTADRYTQIEHPNIDSHFA